MEQKPEYKTIEIRLPLTQANVAYAMLEMVQEGKDMAKGAINDMEARIAVLDGKLETIRRMIEGRKEYRGDPWMQTASDKALFDIILEEIGGNNGDNSLPLPAS